MAMTPKKRKFLRRLAIEKRSRPLIIFEWEIVGENEEVLAIIKAPYGAYAIHTFRLGIMTKKYKSYKGVVTAVPKIPEKKKREKK